MNVGDGQNRPVRADTAGRFTRLQPPVLAALAVVIPLGLGGAVSPVMLTEQTVLLARPRRW